jgi:hypothetical protein
MELSELKKLSPAERIIEARSRVQHLIEELLEEGKMHPWEISQVLDSRVNFLEHFRHKQAE